MTPADLDTRIIDTLQQARMSLPELADALGEDARAILKRLHVLGGLQRVSVSMEGKTVIYGVKGAHVRQPPAAKPAAAPAPKATPPKPKPAPATRKRPGTRITTGATDRIRDVLGKADRPMRMHQVIAQLPGDNPDAIASLVSQRTKAGEFVAIPPKGVGRAYAIAGSRAARVAFDAGDGGAGLSAGRWLHVAQADERWLREHAAQLLDLADRVRDYIAAHDQADGGTP